MLLIIPRSTAIPTMLDRKLFVTLWVMSTRARIAPFGHDVTVPDNQPGRITPVLDRPDCLAERFATKGFIVVQNQVARRLGLAGNGKVDRFFQPPGIDACVRRRLVLPVRIRIIS